MKQEKKLYNQTEIANLIGISKATVSRYLKKNNVSATIKDNAKLYPETVLKQIREAQKPTTNKNNSHPSTIQLLQAQIEQLKTDNRQLQKDKEDLKQQLKVKDEQIATANKLADQAQQLNVLDKKELEPPKKKKKKHWWQ